MALPIAGLALRYGAVALATYAITRQIQRAHYDQRGEDAMDSVNEGIGLRKDREQINATGRYVREIRLGQNGPGLRIDATALGRLRIKKI